MARNQRIFYACQAVAIAPRGTGTVTAAHVVHGVQSVGMSSTFTLEQVFELGQLEIYENVEEVADIEVTIEKVLDGYKTIYNLATDGVCKTDLVGAASKRSDVYVAIFDDTLSNATGVPRTVCMNSGMAVSSVSYNYSIDGNATESVTLVGNDRFWNSETAGGIVAAPNSTWASNPTTNFDGADVPPSGVVRRADVDVAGSTLPAEVETQGDSSNVVGLGGGLHVQSISVSADFGQELIQELGRFGPYTRYATFPVEVSSDFEVIATSGDLVSVSGNAPNLVDRTIIIKDTAGTVLDLGTKNKLTSVSYSGGDTGGGNATVTFSYSNFNSLKVVDGGGA
jgi:hypothetical protein